VALKFLSALNHGLTEALRTADRRLMQLTADEPAMRLMPTP
jgi:hypothetical protein